LSGRSRRASARSRRSWPRAPSRCPLVVAGPEKDAALARELRAGGADLRGYVSKDELASLYRGAAALVLPSQFEGFGLPVLEAMACGTPVIAADEPALREVAGDAAVYAADGDFARRGEAGACRRAAPGGGRARARGRLLVGGDGAADGRGLSAAPAVNVSAIVVSHGSADEVARLVPALAPQVDELVVIANVPGSVPAGVEAVHNPRPLGFAANLNLGLRRTRGDAVLAVNPDTVPHDGAVARTRGVHGRPRPLRRRRAAHDLPGRDASAVAPALPHRRRDDRPPDAASPGRLPASPTSTSTRRRPSHRSSATGCWAGSCSCGATMLDELGGFDEGFRLYGEDIDLQYRAMRAGWERWYVPDALVTHRHEAVTDRRLFTRYTLWHWAGIARFVRKHPSGCARCDSMTRFRRRRSRLRPRQVASRLPFRRHLVDIARNGRHERPT